MYGQQDLMNLLDDEIKKVEITTSKLELAAKSFVEDLNRLPAPYSDIRKSGYTHLVRCFSYKKNNNEVEVGWGKYYGPMLEKGTKKMTAQPHMEKLYRKNENKYTQILLG